MKHYTFVDYATQAYCALVALLILFFHNGTVSGWPWLLAGNIACLFVVHALIAWQAKCPRSKTLDFFRQFYPVLFYTPFFCETGEINRMFSSHYLDSVVIGWDQRLFGCQPSILFMQKLPYLWLSELLHAAYCTYYFMIPGVGLALFLRNRRQFFHYVAVMSFVFYVCYLLYIFLPVIGPMVFCHGVPGYSLPPDVQALATTDVYPDAVAEGLFFRFVVWIYKVFEAPGSAFPSSHVAIAVCTAYFSFRYLRPIRYPHLVIVCLLCLATIYCRFHYVVDVLAGLLTAAILIPIANFLYFKSNPPDRESPSRALGA